MTNEERAELKRRVDRLVRERVDYRRTERAERMLESRMTERKVSRSSVRRDPLPQTDPEFRAARGIALRRNTRRRYVYKRGDTKVLRQYDPQRCGEMLMELRRQHLDKTMSEVADMFDWKTAPLMDPSDSAQRVAQEEYAETLAELTA